MAKEAKIHLSRTIQAAPEVVFRALSNATALREWFCDTALFDASVGSNFYFAWNGGYYATGQVTKNSAPRKLSYTWHGRGEPEPTQVKLTVAKKKTGSQVSVSHEGVGTGKKWSDAAAQIIQGWERGLENLQSVLETGEDMRFTMRPMLGVSGLSEVDDAMITRLNLPVTRGVHIDGTVEGMGARAAGLQKDDVVTAMGKRKLHNYPSLLSALSGRRAGETVEVTYYRDGAKQTTQMTLSKRPLPPIPATAAELAEILRNNFAAGDAQLDQALAGVTEAEADYRTAPDEWNAKEVLAHLIVGERESHTYLTELIASDERATYGYGGNSHLRLKAMVGAYGTVAALVEELKRNEQESVAIAAGLPETFIAERRTYWRLAYSLVNNSNHIGEHAAQITDVVNAARQAASAPAPTAESVGP
jgi:uncharacterized protein YndB with AHSA1/START domain